MMVSCPHCSNVFGVPDRIGTHLTARPTEGDQPPIYDINDGGGPLSCRSCAENAGSGRRVGTAVPLPVRAALGRLPPATDHSLRACVERSVPAPDYPDRFHDYAEAMLVEAFRSGPQFTETIASLMDQFRDAADKIIAAELDREPGPPSASYLMKHSEVAYWQHGGGILRN